MSLVAKAVLFDAGNTLVLLDYAFLAAAARQERLQVDAAAMRLAEERARPALDAYLLPDASTEAGDTFRQYVDLVLAELGVGDRRLCDRIFSRLAPRRSALWCVPAPDAAATLETLAGRGYRLGVVSNSDGTVAEVLARCGLTGHLATIVDSGRVGVEKPDPAIFRLALERLALEPGAVAYVGDLVSIDVRGARDAGLQPVLIDPQGLRPHLAIPTIRDLTGLLDLLPGTR